MTWYSLVVWCPVWTLACRSSSMLSSWLSQADSRNLPTSIFILPRGLFLYSSENGGANKAAVFQTPHKLCPLPFFCPETRDCIKDDLSYWWERGDLRDWLALHYACLKCIITHHPQAGRCEDPIHLEGPGLNHLIFSMIPLPYIQCISRVRCKSKVWLSSRVRHAA